MSFKAIKGTFHVVGYSPDGDSIRFKADNPDSWKSLSGGKVKLNKKEHAQLRIEAIDTLETHFLTISQPVEFAEKATLQLLKLLSIKNVVWNEKKSRVTSADDGTPGFIVSRMAEKYGRPVSFVFDDSVDFTDGQEVYLDKKTAKKSINYKMLSKGLAYPTFYSGMFYDLREQFAKCTVKARQNKKGIWASDTTNTFTTIKNLADITDTYVMLPKLFRRLTTYLKENTGTFNANEFIASLEKSPEKVLILTNLNFTHFDNLLSVEKATGKIKLNVKPEEIVFL